jgi:tetratricopeptide (TPR) repeat protein
MTDSDEQHEGLSVEIQFYEGILAQDPDYVEALIPLAEAYTKAGLYEKGLETDQRLAELRPNDPTVHYNLACSWALTGHRDKALATLEHAIELGFSDVELLMKDEDLVSLHDEEEFARLIARFFPDIDLDVP